MYIGCQNWFTLEMKQATPLPKLGRDMASMHTVLGLEHVLIRRIMTPAGQLLGTIETRTLCWLASIPS